MATYKIRGTRHLRKYTAAAETPVYAAAVDAQKIAMTLCDVPWERSPEAEAQMSYHTEEKGEDGLTGLDKNVLIRERLDAALFCAGHVGGMHRAYANAACYVFKLPALAEGQSYPKLESLAVQVVSDPYNSVGARIAVHTNSTGDIPVVCSESRTGAVHAEGVAKRTERTIDGAQYWYPTSERCELRPSGGLQLERYILVVVALEDYSVVRGNWLEGSSYIDPVIEIVVDGEIVGWDGAGAGDTVDAVESTSILIREVGSFNFLQGNSSTVPCQMYLGADYCIASQNGSPAYVAKRDAEGNIVEWEIGVAHNGGDLNMKSDGNVGDGRMGVMSCYSQFREDRMTRCDMQTNCQVTTLSQSPVGAGWSWGPGVHCIREATGEFRFAGPAVLARKKLLSSFTLPLDFVARKLKLEWTVVKADSFMEFPVKMRHNLWICPNAEKLDYGQSSLQRHELYTAELDEVAGWKKLTSFEEYIYASEKATVERVSDLPFSIGPGPHTLLFTVYLDVNVLPEGIDPARGYAAPVGMGWSNPQVRADENFLIHGGTFEGGWDPAVTLIGNYDIL